MKNHYETLLECATTAARAAGVAIQSCKNSFTIEQKSSVQDFVTTADRLAEKTIIDLLIAHDPTCAILSEETHTSTDRHAPKLWVIDPVDGTTNFAHGVPHFGVSIAYAEYGEVKVGVVYDVSRDELFTAIKGYGAFCNGKPISVSKTPLLTSSLVGTGFYYDRGMLMKKTLCALHALFVNGIHCMRRMGAVTLDLCWLASGRFDAFFEYTLSPWDFAAGLLILTEAGGKAVDVHNNPPSLLSSGIICSNAKVHDELVAIVMNPPPFSYDT